MHDTTTIPEENLSLITEHFPYAQKLARQFYWERRNLGIDLADYEGAAQLGLCYAARRYETEKGQNFRTFAYFRIRGAMYDMLRRSGGVSRKHFESLIGQRDSIEDEEAAVDDKKKSKRLPYSFARDANDLARLQTIIEEYGIRIQVDTDRHSVDISYAQQLSPEAVATLRSTKRYLRKLIASLPPRERKMVMHRYFRDRSFDDLKPLFGGMSKSWLSRLHTRALDNLRNKICEDVRMAS